MQSVQVNSNQQGFTLIELMIVVAIIGILAAIAIPQYQNYIARSQFSEAPTLLSAAQTPVEEAYLRNGNLPDDTDALDDLGVQVQGQYGAMIDPTGVDEDEGEITLVYEFGEDVDDVNPSLDGNQVTYVRTEDDSGRAEWECQSDDDIQEFATDACQNDTD